MNLPHDCFLDYVIRKEAWYAHGARDEPEIQIRAASRDGGAYWEFTAIEVNGIGVELSIFGGAFHAFNDLPEFFQILASKGKGTTLDDVRQILDNLGAVDSTERERR